MTQRAYRHLKPVFDTDPWTLMKPLTWQGDMSLGPRRDGKATFQRLDLNPRWTGVPDLEDAGPRAITAYLRTYGPATVDHIHYWFGEGLSAGRKRLNSWLAGLGDRLVAVDIEGTTAYVVREDVDSLLAAESSNSVRFLPGHDQWVMGVGTKDVHVTPPSLRALVTRKANPVIVGGSRARDLGAEGRRTHGHLARGAAGGGGRRRGCHFRGGRPTGRHPRPRPATEVRERAARRRGAGCRDIATGGRLRRLNSSLSGRRRVTVAPIESSQLGRHIGPSTEVESRATLLGSPRVEVIVRPIANPHIRDTIKIDAAFNKLLATFAGGGPIHLFARIVEQQTELTVGAHPVVFVVDEFRGNGHLVNAKGADSTSPGGRGVDADPTPSSSNGSDGKAGGPGTRGGSVTVMCRRSSGVRINASGGFGAAGGAGGNGGPGTAATSIPGGTTTETHFDSDGNPFEVEVQLPDIEIPGTLGGGGGFGGNGGAGGDAGTIRFTSIVDDTPPVFESVPGSGGLGGAGGLTGPHGAFAEVPPDLDPAAAPGSDGAVGADGAISVTVVPEEEYVAVLRQLLDAADPSFAAKWAEHRLLVGQYFYRQFRKSNPQKGQLAVDEFTRNLELQPDNPEALRWRRQLMDFPRPVNAGPDVVWSPGGLNALGLPRDLDVKPRFEAYRDAFTSFGSLVLEFLDAGTATLVQTTDLAPWHEFLDQQRRQAVNAHKATLKDRELTETEARLAAEAIASVQAQLDQTTADIKAALDAMREEPLDILGVAGTVFGVAAAVVAVIAAVPSLGASLVALAPTMVALSAAVIDNAEPIAKSLLAGDKANTDAIKKAYDKVDKKAADVVKGAKAIADFVAVVQKLTAATTRDNTLHMTLVRHGVELTHELLLARHRITMAQQRLEGAAARVEHAADAVTGIDAVKAALVPTEEALRSTGLHAIAIAESKADALLTIAFYAQRSVEIYNLTDEEDSVRLESGHLHPDDSRRYVEGEIDDGELMLVRLLHDSWKGLLDLLELQLDSDLFFTQLPEPDQRRLSFRAGRPPAGEPSRRPSILVSRRPDNPACRSRRRQSAGCSTGPSGRDPSAERGHLRDPPRQRLRDASERRLDHRDSPPTPGQQPQRQTGETDRRRGLRAGPVVV